MDAKEHKKQYLGNNYFLSGNQGKIQTQYRTLKPSWILEFQILCFGKTCELRIVET